MRAAYTPIAIWQRLRSTYWFVPSVMTLGAIGLAMLMVSIDRRMGSGWLTAWLYSGGADGARSLLSAVAGSTITVVSLTFSVTIVALTVTSQHFGPRLLNNFMRDIAAQIVLGAFIGTFGYCLMTLRTVQGDGDGREPFVPHLAVTVAVALTFASVAALIYFIHHISTSMQVSTITAGISRDLQHAIDRLYPTRIGDDAADAADDEGGAPARPPEAAQIAAGHSGYVQEIRADAVMALACEHGVTIWIEARPGQFIVSGAPLAFVAPAPREKRQFAEALNDVFLLGPDRTTQQDAGFAVQQLVEVALHALSPGMNEPFTAITCIDRLGEGLALLAGRRMPSPARRDESGSVRVIAHPQGFDELLSGALMPITVFAGRNPAISERLLHTLTMLAGAVSRPGDLAAVRKQADIVWREASRQIDEEIHLSELEQQHRSLLGRLDRARRSFSRETSSFDSA